MIPAQIDSFYQEKHFSTVIYHQTWKEKKLPGFDIYFWIDQKFSRAHIALNESVQVSALFEYT